MPWTIYRYILRELLRVLLLATGVLVVVVGFAAAIKPMSDGLLSATGLVKFVFYSMPTVLGLVLPFAAAFASTVVFVRLVADNEILACRASGMSYFSLLLPVIVVGAMLTLGIFYSSHFVVPRFYLLAQKQIEKDLIGAIVKQVQRHQTIKMGKLIIYADAADDTQKPVWPEGEVQPERMLLLDGVAVGRLSGSEGKIAREGTAQRAEVFIFRFPDSNQTYVKMWLRNVVMYEEDAQHLIAVDRTEVPPFPIPNPFKDRLSFLGWHDLQRLSKRPENFDFVRERKESLVKAMATEQTLRFLESALKNSTVTPLSLRASGINERFEIRASKIERNGNQLRLIAQGDTPVRVDTFAGALPWRRYESKLTTLSVGFDEGSIEPRVSIELTDAMVFDARTTQRGTEQAHLTLPRGWWPKPIYAPLAKEESEALLKQARSNYADDQVVSKQADLLEAGRLKLGRRIVAKVHERAATAVSCVLVLTLGALISLYLRGKMTLVVYFWSFLLAILAVIIVHGGENVMGDLSQSMMTGKILLWSGNAILLAAIAYTYRRVSRN